MSSPSLVASFFAVDVDVEMSYPSLVTVFFKR